MSSNILEDDSWFPNPYFGPDTGNYSTAVDTRSLSIIQFPGANGSFFPNPNVTSITNIALLYYESPNGNVSALLNRAIQGPGSKGDINMLVQWIDITSQESKALPHEFRNAPGFNYSSSLGPEVEENATFSYTLYETDPITIFSTPFSSDGTSGSALFYSPSNPLLNAASSLAGGSILDTSYTIGTSGPGNFSTEGMHYAPSYTDFFREMTIMLDSVSTSGNFHSIHQSDIAAFGAEAHCIWINGTQPVLITFSGNGIPMLPSNKFPFTRLASLTSSDGLTTYLYHQMNDTTFAEEEWDDTVQAWSRTDYISLSDS